MKLIKMKRVIEFYKEKEEEIENLELSKKIEKLEKYQKEIREMGEHNSQYILFVSRQFGSVTEHFWNEYEEIENEILKIEKKWKQDIEVLKTMNQTDVDTLMTKEEKQDKSKKIDQLALRFR